jgi:membrane protein DedA with SNARE-associated domain
MRLVVLVLAILVLILAGFLLLGESQVADPQATLDLLEQCGPWAVPLGLGLMAADLLIPVPSSAIMYSYGLIYSESLGTLGGTVAAGIVGAAVCVAASILAYGLCRWIGRRAALRIAGAENLDRVQRFFARWGSLTIVVARPLPMAAEAVFCLAGMSRMPFGRFVLASTVGAVPFATIFAYLGAMGREQEAPLGFLTLSVAIPLVLWIPAALYFAARKKT